MLALAELAEVELAPTALVVVWPDVDAVEAVPAAAAAVGTVAAPLTAAVVPLVAGSAPPVAAVVGAGAAVGTVDDAPAAF